MAEQCTLQCPSLDDTIIESFSTQRCFHATGATKTIAWRIEQIQKLCKAIQLSSDLITEAQNTDNVRPSDFAGPAGMVMGAMGFYCSKIEEWAAPKVLEDTISPERSGGIECDWVQVREPKGVVLNIAPWNAPVLLSILPVIGALAAGNTCIIKPPDSCPNVSALLKEIISSSLDPCAVTVVEGGADVVNGLIDLGFDHIMFTGGPSIGKLIMERAGRHLTPVTLELGGKNPVMIDEMDDGMLGAVIKEIIGSKVYFAGEFCQSHDYFLVLESMWERFTGALGEAIEGLGDKRYVRMIHQRQYDRVKKMLTEQSGTYLPAVAPVPDDTGLRLPVTAIIEPHPEDFVMQDEVFGPIWSILKVKSLREAMDRAFAMPTGKPLVSYYYGKHPENADAWMSGTSSGSLAINSGAMRLQSNFHAAIAGVGNSGLGGASLWGKHVFDTFSHLKHVVRPRGKLGTAFCGSIWAGGAYKEG